MKPEPETILITVGDSFVARNLLSTNLLDHVFRLNPEVQVAIVAKEGSAEQYRPLLADYPQVTVHELPVHSPSSLERILISVGRTCFRSGTLRTMQERATLAGESRIPPWVKWSVASLFGKVRLIRSVVRLIDNRLRPSARVSDLFESVRPTRLFSTLLMDDQLDIPLLREARRRGIPTVGMVRGWDNLSTYGFLRQRPDQLLAQDEYIKEMAITRHDVPAKHISVTGFPHYDFYHDESLYQTREAFLSQWGIPPTKRVVLYAAVGDFLLPGERQFMDIFETIANDRPEENLHFLYRGHPVLENGATETNYAHVSFDAPRRYSGTRIYRREEIRADFAHIINLLRHADIITTTGSTMLLDAAAFNKPPIAIGFDPRPTSYWLSCMRFLDTFDHVTAVVATGAVGVARTPDELGTLLGKDATHSVTELAPLSARFVLPNDGQAALRVAEGLLGQKVSLATS